MLVYESGTIGAKPTKLPLSIGDGELADTADAVVSVPEMFAYWLQGNRIDVGFLGAAQIDRHGNLNSTVIGDYDHPKVRLPGGGGAPEIATGVRDVFVMLRQTPRAFVEQLDFTTSVGDRVRVVVTDLGILEPQRRGAHARRRASRRRGRRCAGLDRLGAAHRGQTSGSPSRRATPSWRSLRTLEPEGARDDRARTRRSSCRTIRASDRRCRSTTPATARRGGAHPTGRS